ncbi:hypothetical protein ZIOFF_068251 [Zingiber officinale]|uniref:Retrovirus-related Pol polyprotein from transposon TNT 1-94-like beta-barrel domain-containing protein n=1 Tax=Zingiber officinale TaxID=94328 RepID=A0A8J5C6T0_ZINOF|nr:hypothetical protein ZIOFF_068251 [Zingiber officinale]
MLPGTFLKGKELWGHTDGSTKEGAIVADRAAWAAKNNQIMTWILVSMEPHLILSLHPHKSAKAMWDYLKQFYNQNNNARRFQLELAIANYTQGDLSVQEYYSDFLTLWNDYSKFVIAKVSAEDPVPTLDICFGELLCEELINTQNIMEHTRVTSNNVSIANAAYSKGKGKGRDMSTTQYYTSAATTTPAAALQPTAPPLTRESVREMIVQAFSALGLQADYVSTSWIVDFGASNHMTNSSHGLSNNREYCSSSSIQIANGSDLPIAAVGDVSSSFKDVFVSPNLS